MTLEGPYDGCRVVSPFIPSVVAFMLLSVVSSERLKVEFPDRYFELLMLSPIPAVGVANRGAGAGMRGCVMSCSLFGRGSVPVSF